LATLTLIQLLNDLELLATLCSSVDDAILYEEFVRRFLPEIQAECLKICKNRKLDLHIGRQIAHETFEKLRKYKSFKADQITCTSSHQGILIYLFRISRNLFNDWNNKEKKSKEYYVNKSYFEAITEKLAIPETSDILQWKRDVSVMIFKKLNKNEQAVVLADIDQKRYTKYLPDEITENLALSLRVKNDTIRKIRERAIKKIEKTIDEINQQ